MIPNVLIVRWTGRKPNKKGQLPIAYQVTVKGRQIPKMSGLYATEDEWDAENRMFTKQAANAVMKNKMLIKEKLRIEAELLMHTVAGRPINHDLAHEIVFGKTKSADFYKLCDKYIHQVVEETGKPYYAPSTQESYCSEVKKLKGFRPSVRCSDINVQFLKAYSAYCKGLGNTQNTIWKSHKFLRTMVKGAIKDEYIFSDPYKQFKLPKYIDPKVVYLDTDELNAWWEIVEKANINATTRLCGLYFLRQCYSGLRVGDNLRMDAAHVNDNWIVLTMQKTKKEVRVPIINKLGKVQAMIGNSRLLVSQVTYNRCLNEIAGLAGIEKRIKSHAGRHTLGYLMATFGVRPEVAQKILGHKKLETTMIYYHLEGKTLRTEMDKIDVA